MVIFPIKKSGRVEKSQKKKKKKKKSFLWDFVPFGFPISGDKKGEKVSGFVFFRKGRVKKGK